MPLLEAMASGVPVIAAATSCLPEICGEAALYFDARDPVSLSVALERLICDIELADGMRRQGLERCRTFTWQKSAEQTLSVFHQVAGRN
jgi:glycosyltransferase involved in cell wall biosynthesis